ncbi:MAG: PAS domain S-box protein [Calditrichaeota bacterium]|nr:PAS domain S-box protein [Calditrichota bacterium]
MKLRTFGFFREFKEKKLAFPVVGLLSASFLLLIILGFLTYLNFNREKKLLKDHLFRQGLTLIRSLEAGARTGMMEMMWGQNQIETLFRETAKGPNIDRIVLIDENGKVLADSRKDNAGIKITNFPKPGTPQNAVWKILNKNDENIFRLIKVFNPLISEQHSMMSRMMGHWMMGGNRNDRSGGKRFIVLDLKMQEYQAAQKEDVRLGVITAFILLLFGSASFYFLLIAQNYYVANRTIKTMKSYTQNVVESMPNGLISLDKYGRIETINHKASELLRLKLEEVKGKPLSEVMFRCDLSKTFLPEEDITERRMECHLNDGEVIPLSTTSSRLKDENGNTIGKVIILRDLRDIKSLEKKVERSQRLASLGRMAAGIAHEIRNPLSSIKGFAQYFRNKFPPGSEDRNYATVMVNEVDRLNRVIQDLLNFAKPQEPNFSAVKIQPLILHVLKLIQSEIKEKNIRVIKDFSDEVAGIILADEDMLTQVFLNMFINAIEATEPGGRLRIGIRENAKHVTIEIEDNGSGIPREHLPRIFDPFFTSKKGGTGLGLAIVYRIMESLHGEIEVQSEPGKGTVFTLLFFKDQSK